MIKLKKKKYDCENEKEILQKLNNESKTNRENFNNIISKDMQSKDKINPIKLYERKKSNSFYLENHKSNSISKSKDKDKNIDYSKKSYEKNLNSLKEISINKNNIQTKTNFNFFNNEIKKNFSNLKIKNDKKSLNKSNDSKFKIINDDNSKIESLNTTKNNKNPKSKSNNKSKTKFKSNIKLDEKLSEATKSFNTKNKNINNINQISTINKFNLENIPDNIKKKTQNLFDNKLNFNYTVRNLDNESKSIENVKKKENLNEFTENLKKSQDIRSIIKVNHKKNLRINQNSPINKINFRNYEKFTNERELESVKENIKVSCHKLVKNERFLINSNQNNSPNNSPDKNLINISSNRVLSANKLNYFKDKNENNEDNQIFPKENLLLNNYNYNIKQLSENQNSNNLKIKKGLSSKIKNFLTKSSNNFFINNPNKNTDELLDKFDLTEFKNINETKNFCFEKKFSIKNNPENNALSKTNYTNNINFNLSNFNKTEKVLDSPNNRDTKKLKILIINNESNNLINTENIILSNKNNKNVSGKNNNIKDVNQNINNIYSTMAKKLKENKTTTKHIIDSISNTNINLIPNIKSKNLTADTKNNLPNINNKSYEFVENNLNMINSKSNRNSNLNLFELNNNLNEINLESSNENLISNLKSANKNSKMKNYIQKNLLGNNITENINFNTKTTKDTLKLSYTNNKNINQFEIEGPEELHNLYVNLNQQNKKLIYKFDKIIDTIKTEKDNSCTVMQFDMDIEL